jgi:hypothetical protein
LTLRTNAEEEEEEEEEEERKNLSLKQQLDCLFIHFPLSLSLFIYSVLDRIRRGI